MATTISELTKKLSQLAEVLEAKGLEAAAKAEVHRKQNEPADAAKEDKRALGGKVYAEVCRDAVTILTAKEKRGLFIAPSLAEVAAEMKRHGLPDREAERFIAHYASNGWKVGRNPMISWKQAIVTWKGAYFEKHPAERPAVQQATMGKILSGGDPEAWAVFLQSKRATYQAYRFAPDFLKEQFNGQRQ